MADVIDLAAEKVARGSHWSGPCRCMHCAHRWVGVAPVGVISLECPHCGLERGVPCHPMADAGEPVLHCPHCHGSAYSITRAGPVCLVCGRQAAWEDVL